LRTLFLERKKRNAAYSTRAFARDLGMSQALVSLVMNGKRPLTVKQAAQISVLLSFSQEQSERFLDSTLLALPENSKALSRLRRERKYSPVGATAAPAFKDYDIERFKAISQWYHLSILDLVSTRDFRDDTSWIARRLGISRIEVTDAIARLLDLGLLERREGRLVKSESKIYFATQRSEAAIRSHHRQMIGKAIDQLSLTDPASFEARSISGMTMSIPKSTLPLAFEKIEQFQKELAALLCKGEAEEVYQLNVQLFPLTKREK
jgi:uncharacterized protein (TIGR02147 family)